MAATVTSVVASLAVITALANATDVTAVRIQSYARSSQRPLGIWEIEVMGVATGVPQPPDPPLPAPPPSMVRTRCSRLL